MALKYYKTDLSIFPVVADDNVFSSINSMGTGNLHDNNGVTNLGNQFMSAFPAAGMVIYLIKPGTYEHSADVYNAVSDLGFALNLQQLVLSQATEYELTGYAPKTTRVDSNGNNSLVNGSFSFASYQGMLPYGKMGRYTAAQVFNCIYLGLLYCNSDMTQFGVCTLCAYPDKRVTFEHSVANNSQNVALQEYFNGVEPIADEPTDPYEPGGESGTGGGTGNFDGTGDDVDFPSLPTLSAVDTGFITLFNPSIGQLQSLANYMWSSGFDLDTFKKLFADPMDCILGLSIVPVAVPNGGSRAVTVGNISTGVTMTTAASQYVIVDCGTLNVNEFWGAYLDYDPFTKAEIYLPYIGTHPIAVDDIMNKAVHVKYHIDILSGACCAMIKCGGSVLYSFVGQCSCSIPITGNDWTNVVNGALTIAASIGTMVATGGATAPMAAATIASTAVNSMKPNVEKSGSMGGMGGMLGVQTPYLILTRPRQALPKNQNKFSGYPSFITKMLGDCAGYTEIDSVHLDGIPATEQELSEIESLLKGGVIL